MSGVNTGKKIKCKNIKCRRTLFFGYIIKDVKISIDCPRCGERNWIVKKPKLQSPERA